MSRRFTLPRFTASARMASAPIATAPAALAPTASAPRPVHASPVATRANATCAPKGDCSFRPALCIFFMVLSFLPPRVREAKREKFRSNVRILGLLTLVGWLTPPQKVCGRACVLAFEPLHVTDDPRVVAFVRKAREGIGRKEAHKAFLGALPEHARLPLPSLLVAVLTVGQLPQLPASFGIGDDPQRPLKGLVGPLGKSIRLACQDRLHHLVDALIPVQSYLLLFLSDTLCGRAGSGNRTFVLRTPRTTRTKELVGLRAQLSTVGATEIQ